MDCSCASQEMPQLQITDQAKHVWRLALRGINSLSFPPSALTPATTFITGRKNIVSCPLTNTCQFQEKELGLFFFQLQKGGKKCFSELQKEPTKNQVETIRQGFHPLSSFLCLTYFSVFHPLSLFGHWVLPCHSSDSSPHNSNGAEILFVIRYGNSTVISQMMPRHAG